MNHPGYVQGGGYKVDGFAQTSNIEPGNSDRLPPDLAAELAVLETMPDETIDTSDMPGVLDWGAERGRFYRPKKVQKTLRLDADVLAWFEAQGPGHLTRMNQALRAVMLLELRRERMRPRIARRPTRAASKVRGEGPRTT